VKHSLHAVTKAQAGLVRI